jgi:hypothetical protein
MTDAPEEQPALSEPAEPEAQPFADLLDDDLEELVRHEISRRGEAPVPRSLLDFLDE